MAGSESVERLRRRGLLILGTVRGVSTNNAVPAEVTVRGVLGSVNMRVSLPFVVSL